MFFMFGKMKALLKENNGSVLALVMGFITLMVLSAVSLSTMIQRDVILIQKVSGNDQARYVAEAGMNHAFADIIQNYLEDITTFSGISGNLDLGSYNVTISTLSGRAEGGTDNTVYLLTSVGTANGISRTVSVEIDVTTATALNYFSGAGNNINLKIHTNVDGLITGDIHANNNTTIIVQSHASIVINGDVSATGIVTEGSKYHAPDNKDKDLWINGMSSDSADVYESKALITFPVFDYSQYKEDAIDSGDGSYYSGDQTFDGVSFDPANGIIYVDGDVTIEGHCKVNGGIIADNINVRGTLEQIKKNNKNVVIAKSGDLLVSGRLVTEEALVYAEQDIATHEKWGAKVIVNGCMLAKRDIKMWNTRTELEYKHVYMTPDDMDKGGLVVLSWNK